MLKAHFLFEVIFLFVTVALSAVSQGMTGNPDPLNAEVSGAENSRILATAVQPDGKMIIAGNFQSVLGVPRRYIARINADGTLDPDFDPSPDSVVLTVVLQEDGRLLVGGYFLSFRPNGATDAMEIPRIARLNADGSPDPGFAPGPNDVVRAIAIEGDGGVLLAGGFTTMKAPGGGPVPSYHRYMARVAPNGVLDESFKPGPSGMVDCILVRPDGKMIITGEFNSLYPGESQAYVTRERIALLKVDGTPDAEFNSRPAGEVYCLAWQRDGKLLLGGNFTNMWSNGVATPVPRHYLARLNPDGTPDEEFRFRLSGSVRCLAVQADEKIVIGGDFMSLSTDTVPIARKRIARVNADGTIDRGFDPGADGTVLTTALQADGKILVGGVFNSLQPNGAASPVMRSRFARLENDPGPSAIVVTDAGGIRWLRGGAAPEISQATLDLSTDGGAVWSRLGKAVRDDGSPDWRLTGVSLPAGGILRGRGSVTVAGGAVLVERRLAFPPAEVPEIRLEHDSGTVLPPEGGAISFGSVELGSQSLKTFTVRNYSPAGLDDLAASLDGLNAGDFTITGPLPGSLAGGGSLDFTVRYAPQDWGVRTARLRIIPGGAQEAKAIHITLSGAVYSGRADGLDARLRGGYVNTTAEQPDGKTLIGGQFSTVFGQQRRNLARLNADDTLDTAFNPVFNGNNIDALAVQADGKVIVGGSFSTVISSGSATATARSCLARLHADGTLDMTFDPAPNSMVHGTAIQPDGKILLWGPFTTLKPNGAAVAVARSRIARVNADGTLDTAFNPRFDSLVYSLALQPDGKMVIGGSFSTLQPTGSAASVARAGMVRLNADGTLDSTFNAKFQSGSIEVHCLALQADGKILAGGTLGIPTAGSGDPVWRHLFRLDAGGAVDTGFDPHSDAPPSSITMQADGRIVIGGTFKTLQPNGSSAATPRAAVARLYADGTLDMGFEPIKDAFRSTVYVYGVALGADGKVWLGGRFPSVETQADTVQRENLARLLNNEAFQSLEVSGTGQAIWRRGGTSPEVQQVVFEVSIDGGAAWIPLGAGVRVESTPEWRLESAALPANGMLRARGRTSGGYLGGTTTLVEQTVLFPSVTLTALEKWRQSWFGTTEDSGGAADSSDFDRDGIPNLMEWACGLDPTAASAPPLSLAAAGAGKDGLEFLYRRSAAARSAGMVFTMEESDRLDGGWRSLDVTEEILPGDGAVEEVKVLLPDGGGGRRFVRLRVSHAPQAAPPGA